MTTTLTGPLAPTPAVADPRPRPGTGPAPRVRRLGAGPVPAPRRVPPVTPPPAEPVDPDDRRTITAAVRTALEVLDGRRSAGQLQDVFDQAPLRYWRAEVGRRATASPVRLLGARLCGPGPASVEVAATCAIDGRVRALAARFDRRGSGWRCTAVRLI